MKSATRSPLVLLRLATLTGLLLGLSACTTVHEGPVSDGGGGSFIPRGTEPEPEKIPQKDVPAGQSSLRHTQPD